MNHRWYYATWIVFWICLFHVDNHRHLPRQDVLMNEEKNEKTYEMVVPVTVRITVRDEPVGDRGDEMHPLDPRRMEGIYDLEDPAQMLEHLAYNAVMNQKECASGLDGWGDIYVATNVEGFDDWPLWQRLDYVRKRHPVRMEIIDVDTYSADHLTAPPTTAEVQNLG